MPRLTPIKRSHPKSMNLLSALNKPQESSKDDSAVPNTPLSCSPPIKFDPGETSTPVKSTSLPVGDISDICVSKDSQQQHKSTSSGIQLQESFKVSSDRAVPSSFGPSNVSRASSPMRDRTQSSKKQLFHDHRYSRKYEEPDPDTYYDEEIAEDIEVERPPIEPHILPSDEQSIIVTDSQEGLDVTVFDLELGAEEDVEDFEDSTEEEGEGVEKDIIGEKKCIVYENKLLELLQKVHGLHCGKCNSPFSYRSVSKGTAIIVTWECERGHKDSWASQPRYSGMFSGNLHMATAILFSGNSFQKVATMSKFLELRMISSTTFNRIQKLYIAPAVQDFYCSRQEELLSSYNAPVVLSGDGRADSPGHSATFCTYSFFMREARKSCIRTA
nr:uncharacterized protein LOC129284134 [Lytechinus pictus]